MPMMLQVNGMIQQELLFKTLEKRVMQVLRKSFILLRSLNLITSFNMITVQAPTIEQDTVVQQFLKFQLSQLRMFLSHSLLDFKTLWLIQLILKTRTKRYQLRSNTTFTTTWTISVSQWESTWATRMTSWLCYLNLTLKLQLLKKRFSERMVYFYRYF